MLRVVGFQLNDEDYDTWKLIKNTILRQHGKLRGVLGHDIVTMIRDSPGFDEKNKKVFEPLRVGTRALKNIKQIYERLPTNQEFPEPMLSQLVGEIAGISKPTLSQYKSVMLMYRIITNGDVRSGTHYFWKCDMPPWLKEVKA